MASALAHLAAVPSAGRGRATTARPGRRGASRRCSATPAPRRQAGDAHPATLVLTADHDDRVVPAHGHEFTAALQAAQAGDAPVLARLETRAGHGAGKPTAKLIAERTDVLAFLVRVLGVNVPPGLGRPSGAAPLGGAK